MSRNPGIPPADIRMLYRGLSRLLRRIAAFCSQHSCFYVQLRSKLPPPSIPGTAMIDGGMPCCLKNLPSASGGARSSRLARLMIGGHDLISALQESGRAGSSDVSRGLRRGSVPLRGSKRVASRVRTASKVGRSCRLLAQQSSISVRSAAGMSAGTRGRLPQNTLYITCAHVPAHVSRARTHPWIVLNLLFFTPIQAMLGLVASQQRFYYSLPTQPISPTFSAMSGTAQDRPSLS